MVDRFLVFVLEKFVATCRDVSEASQELTPVERASLVALWLLFPIVLAHLKKKRSGEKPHV